MFEDMGHATAGGIRLHDRTFPRWVRREMKAGRFVCFLVEEDGKVVGGGSLWLREVQPYPGFPGGKVPYLMSMYTEPSHRGKGVGTIVVKSAIAWSRKHGYSSITLHASRMGRPLYVKMGWKSSNEMELDL
jgi:GNAT superfamily N-acetyltransferase